MGIILSDTFGKLEILYSKIVKDEISVKEKRKTANLIAYRIIQFVYNNEKAKSLKESIDRKRKKRLKSDDGNVKIKKPHYEDFPFKNKIFGELDFLCDREIIPKKFHPSLKFLLQSGFSKDNLEDLNSNNKNSELSLHEIINQILNWFLVRYRQPKDYLIPIHFIDENDKDYPQNGVKEISTFFNIRSHKKKWFEKYQTILAYLFVLLPLLIFLWYQFSDFLYYNYDIDLPDPFGFLGLSAVFLPIIIFASLTLLICSVTSLYNTFLYATNKFVKYIRYFIFSLPLLAVVILLIAIILYEYEENQDYDSPIAILDSDPDMKGEGFLTISIFKDIYKLGTFYDEVDLKEVPFYEGSGEKHFSLDVHVKNIGNSVLDTANIYIVPKYIDNDLIFAVSVYPNWNYLHAISGISDVIRIKNIDNSIFRVGHKLKPEIFYKKIKIDEKGNPYLIDSFDLKSVNTTDKRKSSSTEIYNIPYVASNDLERIVYRYLIVIDSIDAKSRVNEKR